jgi:hypothetical protein
MLELVELEWERLRCSEFPDLRCDELAPYVEGGVKVSKKVEKDDSWFEWPEWGKELKTYYQRMVRRFLRTQIFDIGLLEDALLDQPIPTSVPTIDVDSLSKKKFHNDHLFASKPLLIKRMSQSWPAFTRWHDEEYLREQAGPQIINCETQPIDLNTYVYFKKEYGWSKKNFTFSEFLTTLHDPNKQFNIYFAEEKVPQNLASDVKEPWIAKDLLV